jgi:anaerobic selenocysteine-containing dehydrogenase
MSEKQIIKSACNLCSLDCGILVTLEDGKPVKIKGDPDNPVTKGTLCKIGLASLEYINNPNRLKNSLMRRGARGEGKWEQISWDEATSATADALNKVKREHGPEAVLMAHGSAKGPMDTHLVRLANAFGTPNVVCSDHVCHVPRMLAAEITFGFLPAAEYEHPPACIVVWGHNSAETGFIMYRGITQAVNKGSKLIVIDPLKTEIAEKADLWLQVRPGSDLALALGMLHVIINEGLYDKNFTEMWTVGFEKLRQHIKNYPPKKVEEITWVPADKIIKAARLYATSKPAKIDWGNALDHNVNSFQSGRALAIMMSLTGNLGIPGGEIETLGSGFRFDEPWSPASGVHGRWSSELELRDNISRDKRQYKVGSDLNMLPDFRYTTPQAAIKSILEGDPYYIHAAYFQATNPLSSWSNIRETYKALNKLDFFAVSDMFMTPTAALADVVFPVASYLEYDGVAMGLFDKYPRVQRKVAQVGKCRSDHEIIIELAKKLGLGKYFWDNVNSFWDTFIEPIGLTFNELQKAGQPNTIKKQSIQYKKYEQNGFNTPSKKVELYSTRLAEWGFEPLPIYHEPPETQYSDPELAKQYPLLCTTRKLGVYRHSGGRQISSLRNSHPDPVVIINPKTASALGIKNGDWVYIENSRGRIMQRASLSGGVDQRVVVADHAWWFPEKSEKELFGWVESNYNVLTNAEPPFARETGSFNIRGFACKVYKTK